MSTSLNDVEQAEADRGTTSSKKASPADACDWATTLNTGEWTGADVEDFFRRYREYVGSQRKVERITVALDRGELAIKEILCLTNGDAEPPLMEDWDTLSAHLRQITDNAKHALNGRQRRNGHADQ